MANEKRTDCLCENQATSNKGKRLIDAWRMVIDLAKLKKCGEYDHEDVLAVIASQNTVDAVEVVHARWEKRKDVFGFVRCSACHDCNIYDDWADGKKWNYCPNCGAKMDGDGNG